MDNQLLFKGFETVEESQNAMEEHSTYLKEEYNFDLNTNKINAEEMNKMAEFLREGKKYNDSTVQAFVQ